MTHDNRLILQGINIKRFSSPRYIIVHDMVIILYRVVVTLIDWKTRTTIITVSPPVN